MINTDLPTADPNTFIGEFHEMDLSELKDKTFMVAISTGDRNNPKFISESICGPLSFLEMVEAVAHIHDEYLLHAKAIITSKKFGEKPKVLDPMTIDYIEAKSSDIIIEAMLSGELEKQFVAKAGFIPEDEREISETSK